MSDTREQRAYDRERLNAGMEQATWDGLMAMIRYGIERKTILHIAQKVKRINGPSSLECIHFKASEEFEKAIPRPRITAEDYSNIQYTEDELDNLYVLDGYEWGVKFVQIAYMVYLLMADIDVKKIALMFDVDTDEVQEIQDRFQQERQDVPTCEYWMHLFWEEKVYTARWQYGFKIGCLGAQREIMVRLLEDPEWTPTVIANKFFTPIDVLYKVMESAGIKEKSDIVSPHMRTHKEAELHDEENKDTAEITATPSDDAQEP